VCFEKATNISDAPMTVGASPTQVKIVPVAPVVRAIEVDCAT
jgi:hypothetical protein